MSQREKDLEKSLEWASKRIETLTRENRELRQKLHLGTAKTAPAGAVTLDDVIGGYLGKKPTKKRGRRVG